MKRITKENEQKYRDKLSKEIFGNKSELKICDTLLVSFKNKKPNWWFRMWYKLLLNWSWRNL